MVYEEREQLFRKMKDYLESPLHGPLFIALDSPEDLDALLRESSACNKLRLSDFCPRDDSTPDTDAFFQDVQSARKDALFLLGLGEYAALCDDASLLNRFKALHTSGWEGKIIIPLWNGYEFLRDLRTDPRFTDDFVQELPPIRNFWTYKKIPHPFPVECEGFKALLHKVEEGFLGEISVRTAVNLNEDWGRTLDSAYALYRESHPASRVPKNMFSEDQWNRFLDAGRIPNSSILSAESLLDFLENGTDNAYLKRVVAATQTFADFRQNFIQLFLDISPQDPEFREVVLSRKELLGQLDKGCLQEFFVQLHRFDKADRLPYLSDSTLQEKWEILKILTGENSFPDTLENIYPDLAFYLKDFILEPQGGDPYLFTQLNSYFQEYKRQKLRNTISPDFAQLVEQIARNRPYNMLCTRGSVLETLDKENTKLYWLDCLGCEYLAYLHTLADKEGLAVKVYMTRAFLPTITTANKATYEEWKGDKVESKALDDIKHGKFEEATSHAMRDAPLHLALELDALKRILGDIVQDLRSYQTPRVVLTSDHGATRLAVIQGDEIPWDMPEPGVHGGRCCKVSEFDGVLPGSVAHDDENKWHVLADYTLFKGGRPGSVEVHGGAALEEVIVPVLEFTLKRATPTIVLQGAQVFEIDYKTKSFVLHIFCSVTLRNPSLHYDGKAYPLKPGTEKGAYKAEIVPPAKAGRYKADVYDGQDLLSSLEFTVKKAIAEAQDDFF